MGITKSLSDQLQKKDLDLASAADLVVSTADTLKSLRSDDSWDHTYKYITDVANLFHIEAEEQPVRRRRIRPPRLVDFVSATPIVCHRDDLNDSQSLKTIIYFQVLDHILAELDRRFTKTNLDIMKSLQACHPSSSSFLQVSLLNHLATLYNLDADRLTTECDLAKRMIQNSLASAKYNSVMDIYHMIVPLETAFPTLKKIFQIGLTLAVSTAQCERSFSALKRIKTYLRTSMTDTRLADIALLSIENDVSSMINLDDVVTEFEGQDRNRTILLS